MLYQLIVIGEAAARLPSDVRERHPEIDWSPVIAFRHRVAQGNFALDWSIVWHAASVNVPLLEPLITSIIAAELSE